MTTASPGRDVVRVLLVEDNDADADLVREYLRDDLGPMELDRVSSLAEAEAAMKPDTDIVLVDLDLPDGRGIQAVDAMRQIAPELPVVVLTGRDDPQLAIEALQRDAQDYLVKGEMRGSMLARAVRYAIERHRWGQQYRHQLSVSPDGTIVIDEEGWVIFANSAAAAMLGEIPNSASQLPESVALTSATPVDVTLETGRTAEARSVPTVWQGRSARLVTLRDLTERYRAERALAETTAKLRSTNQKLEALVSTDPLTEVLNRRGIEAALEREQERARRTGDQLIAILIDCDDFKEINDLHGHAVGDHALKELSRSARDALRAGDYVGRVGGDEFLVLLAGVSLTEGMLVAEKLRQAIRSTEIKVEDGTAFISASLAVAAVAPEAVSIEQILVSADAGLRRSKLAGKDRITADVSGEGIASGEVIDPEGISEDIELSVALQSIRNVRTGEIVGHEAFTRGPPGTYSMPSDFFRAAHEANKLAALDLKALCVSLEALTHAPGQGSCHVNLFPVTILGTPVQRLIELLQGSGMRHRLCVEISEQRFLGDPVYFRNPVRSLREAGIQVAIDDVGFGRSSIEALLVLEPDVVKLDRRCIRTIATQAGERRRLERLLAMLRASGTGVIVGGVETEAQLDVLRDLGVRRAQGYYWDKPE